MATPTTAPATLRPDLGGSFMEFDLEMNQRGFIAQRVLPVFNAAKATGNFGIIPIEQLLKTPDTERAPGSGYARGKFTFTPATYVTQEHGYEEPIDDNEAKLYADYFDAEMVSTMRAYNAVLLNAEKRAAAAVFNATTWTNHTTAVTNEWSDYADATPLTDVETAAQAVFAASGLWPNSMTINRKVFRNLRMCAQVQAAIASSGAGSSIKAGDITVQQLAQAFDLDEIIVGGAAQDTALEGQSAVVASVWSDEYAMIGRIVTSNDIREPGIGRTFHWSEDGSTENGTVETYRDERIRGDVVRVRHQVGEKILYAEAGHLLSNITE